MGRRGEERGGEAREGGREGGVKTGRVGDLFI